MHQETLPDLNKILLLIGIQEAGIIKKKYSKEQKQDLMHVAICVLLSKEGYYSFAGRDQDGWPHFEKAKGLYVEGVENQEHLLQQCVIRYFDETEQIEGSLEP
jgi:hypothetical protein